MGFCLNEALNLASFRQQKILNPAEALYSAEYNFKQKLSIIEEETKTNQHFIS